MNVALRNLYRPETKEFLMEKYVFAINGRTSLSAVISRIHSGLVVITRTVIIRENKNYQRFL